MSESGSQAAEETQAEPAPPPGDDSEPDAVEQTADDSSRPWWRRPPVFAAAVAALLGLAYLLDVLVTAGEVPRDVVVAGVDIGGLDQAAAQERLREALEPRLAESATVIADDFSTVVDPETADVSIDFAATVEKASQGSWNPWNRLRSFFVDRPVSPVVSGDEDAIRAELSGLAEEVHVEQVEGNIEFDGDTPVPIDPVAGRELDTAVAAHDVIRKWPFAEDIELTVDELPVKATKDGVRTALEEFAKPAVSGPVTLTGDGDEAVLGPEDIGGVLTFAAADDGSLVPSGSADALSDAVGKALADTETKAKDAELEFGDDEATVRPAVAGTEIDWEATSDALLDVLTTTGDRSVDVAYHEMDPELTTAELEELGIEEVIGEFTTSGFVAASGENIKTVAEFVNGAIVQPGDTFSLNSYTGPRGVEQGYVPAAVIQGGQIKYEVGGGISQFATTLYNAAYFSGLVDVEHKEHSFYISRYPLAREATVYQNPDGSSVIDLAFRNEEDTGIAIQTVWTPSDITVKIWGTKRYEVESVTSDRFSWTGAPVKTIPHGQPCTPQGGASGFSATDTRVIADLDGNELKREERTVVYQPQPAVRCAPPPPKPDDDKDDDDKDEDGDDGDGDEGD